MDTTWSAWIEGWTTWCRAAGHSEATLRMRTNLLLRIAHRYGDRDPATLTTQELAAWLASKPRWTPEARSAARSALRSLWRWAHVAGMVEANAAAALPPVRVPQPLPRPAPRDVAQAAASAARSDVRLMILLALLAGLRRSEIARLRWDDIQDDGALLVHGKGGKLRRVPLHPVLRGELERRRADPDRCGRYKGRAARAASEVWVFTGMAGGHVTPGHVGKLIARELPGKWTAHTLRHRAGTDWYAASERDLLTVAKLLGHTHVTTTQIYVQVPDDALMRAVFGVAA